MLFPEVKKVTYKISSIDYVTCQIQLQSHPALDISAFQKLVKEKYPQLSEAPDEKWKISISGNCLSLSTHAYQGWEDFRDKLQNLLPLLVEKQKLDHFTMVSLRYVYIFEPSKLGLKGTAWKHLIKPGVLGVLGNDDMSDNIENLENISLIKLTGPNIILKTDVKTIRKTEGGELCLMMDFDLTEKRERSLNEITAALNHLNAGLTRIFRWGIKTRLHNALEPEKLP
jgi:uncharacterized protein (TIGR04255 family)